MPAYSSSGDSRGGSGARSRRDRSHPLRRAARRQPRPSGKQSWVVVIALGIALTTTFLVSALLVALFGFGLTGDLYGYLTRDLPSADEVFSKSVFQSALIYDRKGRLLYEMFDPNGGRRTLVHLKDIPPALIDATLSTEDDSFYTNQGVDPVGIARAVFQNLTHQGESGASTITMQLVRNVLMTPEERQARSWNRKIAEAVLSIRVTQRYSKDEILERYLNEIFYGNLAYGVEAAAETYFNKPVRQLTLAEAAMLAGIPQGPALYDPYQHPDAAKARQREVLNLMVRHEYITQDQADAASAEPLKFNQAPRELQAPHYVMYIRSQLEEKFSRKQIYESGLRVYTSLDLDLQLSAETIAKDQLKNLKQYDATNAALVAIEPKTGEVLALLGSVDFWDDAIQGQINMALTDRQPGSTLKPFTYLYAFEHKLAAPASILHDTPVEYPMGAGKPPYRPQNADLKFRGPVTVRCALANSLNVPAIEMLNKIGIGALLSTVHEYGVTSLDQSPAYYGLALTLGGGPVKLLDLTYAYAGLANGGVQIGESVRDPRPGQRHFAPVTILKVTDAAGKAVYEYKPSPGVQLMSPQANWLITDILADDAARAETFGEHSYLELSRPAAVKTGTTEEFQDSWTIGYTPQLVVGVWVGNTNDRPMKNVFGARGAGHIWHDFMETALKGKPVLEFKRPSGLVRAVVDAQTGLKPVKGRSTVTDWFMEGTLPSESAPLPTSTPAPPTPTPVPPTVTPTPPPAPTPTPSPPPGQVPPVKVPSDPNLALVPNLVGLSEADAQRVINESGLMTSYVNYQTINDVPDRTFFQKIQPGHVLSQLPQPGTTVPRGTRVFIAVRKE